MAEWIVECPECGTFVQAQKKDPAVCPKCLSEKIDTTPADSLETFWSDIRSETCRYCGRRRTDFKDISPGEQLHTCPECGKRYLVVSEES